MNQPNFLKHLTLLALWAKACKDHLEYQAKPGKAPPSPDEARADILKAAGIEVPPPPPNPYFKLLAKWKKTGKGSPFNFVFDNSNDPFYQLFCVAQKVLEYPENHWPAGVAGSTTLDLLAMLRPIAKQGGRSATIPDLKRIAELVESILDGKALEAKEAQGAVDSAGKIPNKGGRPKITLSVGVFVDAVTEDTRRRYWTQTQWATHFKCSHQTIGRSPGWEEIQKTWNEESSSVVQADLLDGQ